MVADCGIDLHLAMLSIFSWAYDYLCIFGEMSIIFL